MSDRARIVTARALAVTGAVLATGGILVITLGTGYERSLLRDDGVLSTLLACFFAVFVWLVAPRQPRNALVWVMAISGFGSGLYDAGNASAALMADRPDLVLGDAVVPALLPDAAALLMGFSLVGWYVGLFGWACFGLLLFPDGRPPSTRWRWVAAMGGTGLVAMAASTFWEYRPWSTAPVTEDTLLVNVGAVLVIAASAASLAAVVIRFRRSTGLERDQFKWVVWAAAIMVPFFVAGYLVGGSGSSGEQAVLILLHGAVALMLFAYGIAVGRYRLFDIDVVISRTVVYGGLAAGIVAAYVAVVAGLGRALGSGPEPNQALAVTTTAVIAVVFHPARRRLERAANRLVFGTKATPYEVLAEFSRRVAAADPALLDQAARSLVEGTGAVGAVVYLDAGGQTVETARWPGGYPDEAPVVEAFPIEQDGKVLGHLMVSSTGRLRDGDMQLAGEVAAGMGLALRNQALNAVLEARIEELRASRRRLVEVQDETRRRLERDLHDGAQQQLVALKVKLGLARSLAERAGGARTTALVTELSGDADAAVQGLREFARGVYPPLLEAEGLEVAIVSHARSVPVPVSVEADGIGRYDRPIEAAAYFCVVEALRNVTDHAGPTTATVRLAAENRSLVFEVVDNGRGFDSRESPGRGLADMELRVDALGGELVLSSEPGQGTLVRGAIPVGGT